MASSYRPASGNGWRLRGPYLRDAQIVVLDEPTAALDPRAEVAVYRQFSRAAAGRCAVLISHRLGVARLADRIVVLTDGRLVEEGSHDALLQRDGVYARHVPPPGELVHTANARGVGTDESGTLRRVARWGRRLRYLPRVVRLLWTADAGGATAIFLLSASIGLFVVAEVHVLRRMIEAAQQVVEGDGATDQPASGGVAR